MNNLKFKSRKAISLLLSLVLLFSVLLFPQVAEANATVPLSQDSLDYGLDKANKTARVYCKNGEEKTVKDIIIPEKIEREGIEYSVTEIAKAAFYKCESLEKITIPDSITKIGGGAFSKCKSLEKITIPDGITKIENSTFSGCEALEKITLPDTVESIGDNAFRSCKSLKEITLSKNLVSIGEWAFWKCEALEKIILPDTVTKIGMGAFQECKSLKEITLSQSLALIERQAISGCRSLEKITIPDSVTRINRSAFAHCDSLKEVILSKNLAFMEGEVFEKCKSLENIEIPDMVPTLEYRAFMFCTSLKSIKLPLKLTAIAEEAFVGCGFLRDIYYAGTKQEWDKVMIFGEDNQEDLKQVTIHFSDGTSMQGSEIRFAQNPSQPSNPQQPSDPSQPSNPSKPTETASSSAIAPYVPSAPSTPSTPSTPNAPNNSHTKSETKLTDNQKQTDKTSETSKEKASKQPTHTAVKAVLSDKISRSESHAPKTFADTAHHWANQSIQFITGLGVLNGVGENEFSPNTTMSRAMFVTALGRLAEIDEKVYQNTGFSDVEAGAYYRGFAEWAKTAGITNGINERQFAPNEAISREQLALMVVRFAQHLGYEFKAEIDKKAFSDEAAISPWAKAAVSTLQQAGILEGKGNGLFAPKQVATRAEVAAIMQKLVKALTQ